VLYDRVSPDTSEVETASDASVNTASVVSETVSQVVTASDDSQPVWYESPVPSESAQTAADSSVASDNDLQPVRRGSPVPTESARTAVDSSAMDSPLSSVHTSPSLQHHQPADKSQPRPSTSHQGQ